MSLSSESGSYISARISEYKMPPLKDMLVMGKDAPIGCIAMKRALDLLVKTPYEHIEVDDDVIGDILIRQSLLRRISKEQLMDFVLTHTKSLLGSDEVLHIELSIDVHLSRIK
ncbi:MAG: hypothetical protein VX829_00880 [Pseudomonadota bacterium]|jgi:hypothetical protein|uniref:Uncharacterized protein n=1 Tax=Methylophaga thalassica TaxID=40223 RepID=A0ABQ5TTX3_9GAMM|nr:MULTISPECIES: hypothetical protein [Methylophaga]MEC9411210.1 hypothetical protein [Pseudomonadota bacterium]WVI84085.1 hypothetical protein VSX76_09895 [Methylophaga thalassica]GLP99190.1 hypothetical protein GCM10007891_10440 [Methylophaga thalassica]HIC45562.1 hypothetical protein [Methylophaga sp.]HIM39534.1 hypothetical protein [Methylophaga aminisulfidivorans]